MYQRIRPIYRMLLSILLVFVSQPGNSQYVVEKNKSIYSKTLEKNMSYSILLPENYYSRTDSFPVLYLLHGFGGDHNSWIVRCKINELVDSVRVVHDIREIIVVMPDVGNSYYINNYDSSNMIGNYLNRELVPSVDSLYRTDTQKYARAIMGLSMGGFGAIINATRHKENFGIVIALSAAVRTESIYKNMSQDSYEKFFSEVFGPGLQDSARITEHWKENSPYTLIDSSLAEQLRYTKWYIDCGLNDHLLPANEAFHQLLMKFDLEHEYHVRPGRHNWAYWYKTTVYGLLYLDEKLSD